jgi:hypothetical protein
VASRFFGTCTLFKEVYDGWRARTQAPRSSEGSPEPEEKQGVRGWSLASRNVPSLRLKGFISTSAFSVHQEKVNRSQFFWRVAKRFFGAWRQGASGCESRRASMGVSGPCALWLFGVWRKSTDNLRRSLTIWRFTRLGGAFPQERDPIRRAIDPRHINEVFGLHRSHQEVKEGLYEPRRVRFRFEELFGAPRYDAGCVKFMSSRERTCAIVKGLFGTLRWEREVAQRSAGAAAFCRLAPGSFGSRGWMVESQRSSGASSRVGARYAAPRSSVSSEHESARSSGTFYLLCGVSEVRFQPDASQEHTSGFT